MNSHSMKESGLLTSFLSSLVVMNHFSKDCNLDLDEFYVTRHIKKQLKQPKIKLRNSKD